MWLRKNFAVLIIADTASDSSGIIGSVCLFDQKHDKVETTNYISLKLGTLSLVCLGSKGQRSVSQDMEQPWLSGAGDALSSEMSVFSHRSIAPVF